MLIRSRPTWVNALPLICAPVEFEKKDIGAIKKIVGGDNDLTRRCAYYTTSSEMAARYGPRADR